MPAIHRVLDPHPVESLDEYLARGGGRAIDAARQLDGAVVIGELTASGLRGRGGAGFPTGVKWQTVGAGADPASPPTVVVNGAEGEPGSFKDRALLRRNPYRVLEGSLIAAAAVGARQVVVALKQSFLAERRRLAHAIAELCDAGWLHGVAMQLAVGPSDYLFGEETALLEVLAGRQPFPRIAPPYRRGLDAGAAEDEGDGSDWSSLVLANNVETLANVPGIVIEGADWFRSVGTADSPGTIVCTVSGDTQRAGVGEFPMGTPVAEIIAAVGGGPRSDRRLVAAISGVANPILPAELFGTAASHEALRAAGSGLGAAGFIVIDDSTDLVSVAEGVSRFLAVESCGQCVPCKRDGLAIHAEFDALRRSDSDDGVEPRLRDLLATITDGARCSLAEQHQLVATSVLDLFGADVARHATGAPDAARVLIAPIVDIDDGVAVLDTSQARKQPDWSYDLVDSSRWPAAALADTPVQVRMVSQHRHAQEAAAGVTVEQPRPVADGADASEVTPVDDADRRPVSIDVGEQLDLDHHELVDALLRTAMAEEPSQRRAAADTFADRLRAHVEATTRVLLPWVRRVGDDEGERIADRAEALEAATEELLERVRGGDTAIHALARDLHRMILDEERRVLPILERHLGEGDLEDIGRAMHEARLQRPEERAGHGTS
jgi:NADH:ubiquinone oxidoreductase subunit F (NADH-binding)